MPKYIVLYDDQRFETQDFAQAVRVRDQTGGEIYEHVPQVSPLADLFQAAIDEQRRVKVRIVGE